MIKLYNFEINVDALKNLYYNWKHNSFVNTKYYTKHSNIMQYKLFIRFGLLLINIS